VAAEVDDLALGYVERVVAARIPADLHPEGVGSWVERRLDRFMSIE
jgi:hypothetical protein